MSPKYHDTYLVCRLSLVCFHYVGHILQVMSAITLNNKVKQFPFDILKSGWGKGTLLVLCIDLKQSDLALVLIHPGSASL